MSSLTNARTAAKSPLIQWGVSLVRNQSKSSTLILSLAARTELFISVSLYLLRLIEACAVFRRGDEAAHHLRINVVAVEVQLIQPVLIARRVRVASQITKVFHQH